MSTVPVTGTVREATVADAPALFRAWQALRTHNAGADPRIIPAPVSEIEFTAGLRELLSRPTGTLFVAEVDGRLAGFIRAGVEQNAADRLPEQHVGIGYLYVEPAARRRGLGRQLFAGVREWAGTQAGVAHFEMTVLNQDGDAEEFWRSLGFTPFIQRLWAPLEEEEPEPA
ncbi:MAG: GNAT family N-acetyltransferase [Dehalococcoidia bacterium]